MNIRAIVVCSGFADLLAHSLCKWHTGSDRLVVITSSGDKATQDLCASMGVETHVTDIFWENGAHFNKSAAMAECVAKLKLREGADWLLTFDADMVPPKDWRDRLEAMALTPGLLYGSRRYQNPENTKNPVFNPRALMPQHWVIGFFTLFHNSDRALPQMSEPLFDLHWPHAGNYDTAFSFRWRRQDHVLLPLPLIHLGEERANWMGRGKKALLHKKVFSQRPHINSFGHEKMENPPTLLVD